MNAITKGALPLMSAKVVFVLAGKHKQPDINQGQE